MTPEERQLRLKGLLAVLDEASRATVGEAGRTALYAADRAIALRSALALLDRAREVLELGVVMAGYEPGWDLAEGYRALAEPLLADLGPAPKQG